MFSVSICTTPIFIMDDTGEISGAKDCILKYNGYNFHFIEKNGLYAYADFFEEGVWPEPDDEDEEKALYDHGIQLTMSTGGWNEKLSDLIQTIGFVSDQICIDNKEIEILSFIDRLKNGEGIFEELGMFLSENCFTLKNY
jgi:hypothetical protein